MQTQKTQIIPVVREASEGLFVSEKFIPREQIELDGVMLTTAPLKFGIRTTLLGISQTDELLVKGTVDRTDEIDPEIKLQAEYLLVRGKPIVLSMVDHPDAAFVYAVRGNYRARILNCVVRDFKIRDEENEKDFHIQFSIDGQLNLELADIFVDAEFNDDLIDIVTKHRIVLLGYTLKAYRTNCKK